MTARPSTKHDIQRDDENTTKQGFAVIQKILVTGSIFAESTGADSGTGDVLLLVSGTVTNGDAHNHSGGDGGAIPDAMASAITLADSKSTVVGADAVAGIDTENGNSFIRITMTAIRTFGKTLFDTLYAPVANGVTNGDSHNHVGGDGADLTYIQTLPMHGLNGTPAAGSTNYLPPFFYGVNAISYNFVSSVAGTLKNLSIITNSAQPASGSLVFTVRVNNSDTSFVVTVAAGAAAATHTNTSDTVSVSAGDLIIVKVVNNAAGASAQIGGASLQLEVNTG